MEHQDPQERGGTLDVWVHREERERRERRGTRSNGDLRGQIEQTDGAK